MTSDRTPENDEDTTPTSATDELRRAATAFDRGDYQSARALAERVLSLSADAPEQDAPDQDAPDQDAAEQDAAEQDANKLAARKDAARLLAQLEPPRLTKILLALTFLLLTLVTVFAYTR